MSAWVHALKTYFQQPCCCLSIDTDLAAAVLSAGGIDALLAVAGAGAEPVLAAAAMQTLTALVGSADAKALLLQHPQLPGVPPQLHAHRQAFTTSFYASLGYFMSPALPCYGFSRAATLYIGARKALHAQCWTEHNLRLAVIGT